MAFVAQVFGQLSVQGSLDQQFGQLLEQAVLANQVFGLFVVGQQARPQFFGYVVFLGAHGVYGQAGLRRQWIGRLHKVLHTLIAGPRQRPLTGMQTRGPTSSRLPSIERPLPPRADAG